MLSLEILTPNYCTAPEILRIGRKFAAFHEFNGSSRHAGSSKCVGSVCLDRCGIAGAIHSVMDECVECVWEGVRCTFPAVSFTQTDDYAREM